MSRSQSAFSPGHITAFFEICDQHDNPMKKGSRGVGITLTLGATSNVRIEESDRVEISVEINGEPESAPVSVDAIDYIIENKKIKIEVSTRLDLPYGQGFAMSAAGALSASLATCKLLGLPPSKAVEAAHIAEIKNGTGLGDVAGIYAGGIELRDRPGIPPYGEVERIDISADLVLAVVGPVIVTRDVLTNKTHRDTISESGRRCIEAFSEDPTIDHLFALGMEFTEETMLASEEVLMAMTAAEQYGMTSMAMLGNSIFCTGDSEKLVEVLHSLGEVFVCQVEKQGPRIISSDHS